MLITYKAILWGNRIEWNDDISPQIDSDSPVAVYITLLDEPDSISQKQFRGQRMAAALDRLAAGQAFASIPDPAVWEREIRQDRSLPDRD